MPLKFKLLCTVRVHSLLLTSRIALYGCPSLFIHLLIEAYLSYFQFRAIVNSADINIHVHVEIQSVYSEKKQLGE